MMECCSTKMQIHLATITIILSLWNTPAAMGINKSYIVYLGGHSHGAEASTEDYENASNSHHELLASFLGGQEKAQDSIFYSYTKYINGFAAHFEENVALQISRHPSVISVFENQLLELYTTRSWNMMDIVRGNSVPASSILTKARFGEDTIIGSLDTGVWPESKSFDDEGLQPVPKKWKGLCVNNTKEGVPCNRKLIGARYFNLGYKANYGEILAGDNSTRDFNGHGTHTLSTAAGRFVDGVSYFGYANGTAMGGAPHSRVAEYKICWDNGCAAADILAAFDSAIHDGVDVISVSFGQSNTEYMSNPLILGAFHATMNGIAVVAAAGNYGSYSTVANIAPWITTVGASTVDRNFKALLTLGNQKQITGMSFSAKGPGSNKFYPLINAADAKAVNVTAEITDLCQFNSLDPKKVKGKIVVCLRGRTPLMDMSEAVVKAGGAGVIFINYESRDESDISPEVYFLPAIHITYSDGVDLTSYMNSTRVPVASIYGIDVVGVKPAPVIAEFSSRGPNVQTPQILKPDITAPGVDILAAYSEVGKVTDITYDNRRISYSLMSGTSMSCPHVSGVTSLLKTMYPNWSPAAIRSAIMTTAMTRGNDGLPMKDPNFEEATPFAYGAGHMRPNRAMDPGLIYDLTPKNYLDFLCACGYNSDQIAQLMPYKCPSKSIKLEDFNYPSITVPNMNGSVIVTRTVKNVGSPGMYKVRISAPKGTSVSVKPKVLNFEKVGEEKQFKVYINSVAGGIGKGYVFGSLVWSDGKHLVRSPLVVSEQ